MVLRRCRGLLREEEAAREAMQDVFVQLLRKQEELTEDYPSSLLYCMATNICLNRIRRSNRSPVLAAEEDLLQRIAGADDPEERVLAGHFLERLFEGQKGSTRTLAVLHYVDGMTLAETAEQVGLSVSGVRKRLRKLRAAGLELRDL